MDGRGHISPEYPPTLVTSAQGWSRKVWGCASLPPQCTQAGAYRAGPHVADIPSVSPRQIWVGGTSLSQGKSTGKIYVIDAKRKTVEKELVAHADAVKTLCSAEDRYVLSGSGSGEGKIAIWKVE